MHGLSAPKHKDAQYNDNQAAAAGSQVWCQVALHACVDGFPCSWWCEGLARDALVKVHVAPRQLLNQLTRGLRQHLQTLCVCVGGGGGWLGEGHSKHQELLLMPGRTRDKS